MVCSPYPAKGWPSSVIEMALSSFKLTRSVKAGSTCNDHDPRQSGALRWKIVHVCYMDYQVDPLSGPPAGSTSTMTTSESIKILLSPPLKSESNTSAPPCG